MPLLEINQTRYISASVRVMSPPPSRSISTPLSSTPSADDVVDKALNLCLLEGP